MSVPRENRPGRDPLTRIGLALRRVTVPFPWLAGLAAAARVHLDTRVPTMGVFASGRMVAHPRFVESLNDADLGFVVAHELLHVALHTHRRARGSDLMQFNIAHDYIINDILRTELGLTRIPGGGLDMPGARLKSAEQILLELRRDARAQAAGQGAGQRVRVWQVGAAGQGGSSASQEPGPGQEAEGDVLADTLEREWFDDTPEAQRERQRAAEAAARRGLEIARARGQLPQAIAAQMGLSPGSDSREVDARRGAWHTPGPLALQRWIEASAMGPRTFERPSRRAQSAPGVVLPGRRRESWTLNVVLDTSGSMTDELPAALGAISDACQALGIDSVRLVQCDAAVTADDRIEPQHLSRLRIDGWGGSDLSPALRHLAADPQVQAVIVITDGDIAQSNDALPFELLWLITPQSTAAFRPAFGRVLHLSPKEARP